jgi:CysZ protein
MRFFQQIILGFKSYLVALKIIKRYRLYWYLPIPAVLMLIIYYLGSSVASWQASWDSQLGCLECRTMNDTIWFLLKLLVSISLGLALMKFAKYIVVIVLSPLFSVLSQVVERKLTGNKYPFNLQQTIHDVKRGVRIALRNVMWEYIYFLLILAVVMMFWDDPFNSPIFYITYLVGFFYYGFSFIDYINERRRLDIDQSIYFMRKYRGLAIAIGSVYSLLIFVPVDIGLMLDFSNFLDNPYSKIGQTLLQLLLWFLASSAPILAIVAATVAMHDLVDLSSNVYSEKEIEESTDENDK